MASASHSKCIDHRSSGLSIFLSLITILSILFLAKVGAAAELKVAWDQPADSGITGYKVYYGTTSRSYANSVDAGQVDTYTICNLDNGKTYYIAATSYDSLGNESDFSEEISATANSGNYLPAVSGSVAMDQNWSKITVSKSFQSPVAIIGPPSYSDSSPGVVRVRNVNGNSFEVRFQEWLYLDGSHGQESAAYLVLEKGRYQLDDGTVVEVGTFSASGTGQWTAVNFTAAFPGAPAVFLTMQSYNGTDTVAVRAKNVTQAGFDAALFEEEAKMDGHITEEMGYLAIYSSSYAGTFTFDDQEISFNYDLFALNDNFAPIFEFELKAQEEKSKDAETVHSFETVAVLSLDSRFFAQDVSSNEADTLALRRFDSYALPPQADFKADATVGTETLTVSFTNQSVGETDAWWWDFGDGATSSAKNPSHEYTAPGTYTVTLSVNGPNGMDAETKTNYIAVQEITASPSIASAQASFDHNWQKVNLTGSMQAPVVIVGPPSYKGQDPGVVRLRNVNGSSFELRFQEWMYKDGWHTQETASYLVLDTGRYELDDGTILEVGSFSADGTGKWCSKTFSSAFSEAPALFLTMQTYNGTQTVAVRARNVTQTGFQAALFEEETLMDGHLTETIGYLAIYNPDYAGTITNAGGQQLTFNYDFFYSNQNFTPVFEYDVKVEEEQSKDAEVSHVTETIAVLTFNNQVFAQDVTTLGGDTAALRVSF